MQIVTTHKHTDFDALASLLGAHKLSGTLLSETGQFSMEALRAMQDTLLEYGVIKKRLPLEEHVVRDFVPVRLAS